MTDTRTNEQIIAAVIVCEPRTGCADANIHRWHCMRGHEGAAPGVCPLRRCVERGANEREAARG